VTLVVGVIWLPIGWAVDLGERSEPVTAGRVSLPQGGCLVLPSGVAASVLPGTWLRVVGGTRVHVGSLAQNAPGGTQPTVSINVSNGKAVSKADITGAGTAAVGADISEGRRATADAAIQPGSSSTTATT